MSYVEFLSWHRLIYRRSIRKQNASARAEYEQSRAETRKQIRGG